MPSVKIEPGNLRHYAAIQQDQGSTQTATGQEPENWVTIGSTWASIEGLSGRELEAAQRLWAKAQLKIEMRYRPGITSLMRLQYQGRNFNFGYVTNVEERNIKLYILATELITPP